MAITELAWWWLRLLVWPRRAAWWSLRLLVWPRLGVDAGIYDQALSDALWQQGQPVH